MNETPADFLEAVRALQRAFPESPPRYVLPLTMNTLETEEIAAALHVLVGGKVTLGERVQAFEKAFAERHGMADAVFCNSGSSANLLAVEALNAGEKPLGPEDEIVVPAVTWSTSVWPIAQAGAIPVLADVSAETMNVTVESVERALSPKTRAILLVHLLGNPAPVKAIRDLCKAKGLTLIEDTCESLDATTDGKRVGTFGRFGTFSTYFSHHICTMEGGVVTCATPEDGDLLRAMRAHGWTRHMRKETREAHEQANPTIDPRFLFVTAGYNLRPTEVAAAMGLVQLRRASSFLEERRKTARVWSRVRDSLPSLFEPMRIEEGSSHFALPLVMRSSAPSRTELFRFLEKHGVETRPLVAGNLARQPALRHMPHRVAGPLVGAEVLHERGGYVGIHPKPLGDAIDLLPSLLKRFAEGERA